jgi:FrmR/RcnR family transcriptional regulator, repressor of rcnA expression
MEMDRERVKLVNRAKRINGQMERVQRCLTEEHDCTNVLMLLAAVRGGIDGLMAEVLEDHIRLHLIGPKAKALTPELGEELIDLVRAYMK